MLPHIPANILFRIEWLGRRSNDGFRHPIGSGFLTEIRDKKYLVTAHHVIENYQEKLCVRRNKEWVDLSLGAPLVKDKESDVTVFEIHDAWKLPEAKVELGTPSGFIFGQLGYALGFPTDGSLTNHINEAYGHPLAIPTLLLLNLTLGTEPGYCPAYINAGYSGGAVVYPVSNTDKWSIAGVITHFQAVRRPVFDNESKETEMYVNQHMGLLKYTPWQQIQHLIDIASRQE